ncbi:MAG: hypothetical protein GOU97_03145, partial [Nanoarchaeota archaeon]|nr:hypothetical protein [Nanoarchaeota archaeon]
MNEAKIPRTPIYLLLALVSVNSAGIIYQKISNLPLFKIFLPLLKTLLSSLVQAPYLLIILCWGGLPFIYGREFFGRKVDKKAVSRIGIYLVILTFFAVYLTFFSEPQIVLAATAPTANGIVLIPDNTGERVELYAEGTQWTPDSGDFSEKSTDAFEGSYSTHNRGSWVRKSTSFSGSTYPRLVFAYKIDVGETACIMINGDGWYEIADTATTCSSYPHSTNAVTLQNDGEWHVVSVDISDRSATHTSIITGGGGDIYLDNVYAIKNRVFTAGGSANVAQWMYINCYDVDSASLERSMGLINYQGDQSAYRRGYMHWVSPSTYGQYANYGDEYSNVVAGSSNWVKGDNFVAKIKWEALATYTSPQDNDISQYCDDGPLVDGWDNVDLNFDVYACSSNDATGDTYCASNQYCSSLSATGCTSDLANGGVCTRASQCTSAYCNNGYCCVSGTCCASDANCAAGNYCSSNSCATCSADYYCVAGAGQVACPSNSDTGGATGSDAQIDCHCDGGYYDVDGDTNGRACTAVGVGYYSADNTDTRTICAADTYSSTTTATSCTSCPTNSATTGSAAGDHDALA